MHCSSTCLSHPLMHLVELSMPRHINLSSSHQNVLDLNATNYVIIVQGMEIEESKFFP